MADNGWRWSGCWEGEGTLSISQLIIAQLMIAQLIIAQLIMVGGGVDAGRRRVLSALPNSYQLSPHLPITSRQKQPFTPLKASRCVYDITITIGKDTRERPKTRNILV